MVEETVLGLRREVTDVLKRRFVGRDEVVDLIALAVVAGEHLFLHGPPGTAKSALIRQPLEVTETLGKFDIWAKTLGGGISGQAGAMRHGISKALVEADPDLRPALRKLGFLTRDPRVKERKKAGRKRARRGFQFSKR